MHISALAANIEDGGFVAEQNAFCERFVQVFEYHFVPYFHLCDEFEKVGNIFKTFFFGILLKSGIDCFVFVSFVVCGKF